LAGGVKLLGTSTPALATFTGGITPDIFFYFIGLKKK